MSPVGAIFVPSSPKTGTNMLHPPPPNRWTGLESRLKRAGFGRLGGWEGYVRKAVDVFFFFLIRSSGFALT